MNIKIGAGIIGAWWKSIATQQQSPAALIEENVIASIVKRPEDEAANVLVVRLVNLAVIPSTAVLSLSKKILSCQTINFKEEIIETLQFDHKKVTLTVPANGIVSLRVQF